MRKHNIYFSPSFFIYALVFFTIIVQSCSTEPRLICIKGCPKIGSTNILVAASIRTDSTGWNFGRDGLEDTISFDMRDYENLKSIRLEAEMFSEDEDGVCYVHLYNLDDKVVLEGSEINNKHASRDTTANLLSSFPSRKINLAVRIRSSKSGKLVFTGRENVLLLE